MRMIDCKPRLRDIDGNPAYDIPIMIGSTSAAKRRESFKACVTILWTNLTSGDNKRAHERQVLRCADIS
jgi:hypothetical protein